jgi:hypothetical protein
MQENQVHKQLGQDGNKPFFSSDVNREQGAEHGMSTVTETITRENIVALVEAKKEDVAKVFGEGESAKEVTDVLDELINDIRAQRNSTTENGTSRD